METAIIELKKVNDTHVKTGDVTKTITEILGLSQDDARLMIKSHKRGQVVKIRIPIECVLKNIRRQLLKKNINIQIDINDEKV